MASEMKSAGKACSKAARLSGRVRVAPLGERHRPRVEPGVEHVGDPPGLLPAVRAGEGDLVHERPVGVEAGQVAAGLGRQVGQALDHGHVPVRAAPQRQGRAPVAGPGQRPVDVVGQPVAEAAVADVLGAPADAGVLGQQPVLDRRGPGVPGGQRVVDQRRAAAPAVRVGVGVGLGPPQQPPPAQVLDQVGVGRLDEPAGQPAGLGRRRCRRARPGAAPGCRSAGPRPGPRRRRPARSGPAPTRRWW